MSTVFVFVFCFIVVMMSIVQWKTAVTPLLTHWSHRSLALTHQCELLVDLCYSYFIRCSLIEYRYLYSLGPDVNEMCRYKCTTRNGLFIPHLMCLSFILILENPMKTACIFLAYSMTRASLPSGPIGELICSIHRIVTIHDISIKRIWNSNLTKSRLPNT